MANFATRSYNSFTFDYQKSIIKKISKETRLLDETNFYKNLTEELRIYFPRLVLSGQDNDKNYFMELELYPYNNLGTYLVGERNLTDNQWINVCKHIKNILKEFQNFKNHEINLSLPMKQMYVEKTENEYQNLINNFELFSRLSNNKIIEINGKQCLNFEQVWPEILKKYEKILNENVVATIIHGDLCFSNILLGFDQNENTIIRLIDPRGKFGNVIVYGDPYYDLAKLRHSTNTGYECFIYDKFDVNYDTNLKSFKINYTNGIKNRVHEIFNEHIYSEYNMEKIKLIEGLIYIGMCARHFDNLKRQIGMFCSGIKILNELLEA